MTINTKRVTGRRELNFTTLDGMLQDTEQLANSDVETLGNWSPGQIFSHLAITMNCSIDGFPISAPWILRVVFTFFMKERYLSKTVSAGFKIPPKAASMNPGETSTEEGLAMLRSATERMKQETNRVSHPVLGELSIDDWNRFHLRHAEMHMSFARLKSNS